MLVEFSSGECVVMGKGMPEKRFSFSRDFHIQIFSASWRLSPRVFFPLIVCACKNVRIFVSSEPVGKMDAVTPICSLRGL